MKSRVLAAVCGAAVGLAVFLLLRGIVSVVNDADFTGLFQ